ncbi:MAG: HlyD family secretion protein [Acidimicrobiales bacterium]
MPGTDADGEQILVFEPGAEPGMVVRDDLGMLTGEQPPLTQVDRGSRAETVTYGGGLRATSRRIGVAVLVALVVLAAIGYIVYLVNAQSANRYSAVIVPANVLDLTFPTTAPLAEVVVGRGERVHVGEVLAKQANESLVIEVALSKAILASERQRLHYLLSVGHVSSSSGKTTTLGEEILQTADTIRQTRLELALNKSRLALSILRAPMNGVVLRTAGLPGELAGPTGVHASTISDPAVPTAADFRLFPNAGGPSSGTNNPAVPVVSLVSGRRWQVIAEVPETAVDSFKPGTQATFAFTAFRGLVVPCIVRQVVPSPVEVNGVVEYDVLLRLERPLPSGVLPGMSGVVSIG